MFEPRLRVWKLENGKECEEYIDMVRDRVKEKERK